MKSRIVHHKEKEVKEETQKENRNTKKGRTMERQRRKKKKREKRFRKISAYCVLVIICSVVQWLACLTTNLLV